MKRNTGLIPAGAGNMVKAGYAARAGRAHPRGCGEHSPCRLLCVLVWGSSPRVRGTYCTDMNEIALLGLIPAGAGNMGRVASVACCARAHPRGCGEHDFICI